MRIISFDGAAAHDCQQDLSQSRYGINNTRPWRCSCAASILKAIQCARWLNWWQSDCDAWWWLDFTGAPSRDRTGTIDDREILSLLRLPIPPWVRGAVPTYAGAWVVVWRKVRDSNPGVPCDTAGFPYYYSFHYQALGACLIVWTLPSPWPSALGGSRQVSTRSWQYRLRSALPRT